MSCAALCLPQSALASTESRASAAATADAAQARTITDLSNGWTFRFDNDATGVEGESFDDSGWDRVNVPHTWNRLGEYRLQRSDHSDNRQGIGWYRLRFDAPARSGQRHYVEFDGVGNIAQVWLNGTLLTEHRGAFSRFRVDVTDQMRAGSNLLVVRADNSKPRPGSSTQDVLPLAGDFFIYGGIYRGVRLITVDPAHIDLEDFGGPGVYAHSAAVSDAEAQIAVLVRLANEGNRPRRLRAETTIRDADGQIVASTRSAPRLAAASRQELTQQLVIPNPRRWNGRTDPYLYRVTVELRDGSRLVDRVEQPLGVRDFRFDANEGFFLNGRHVPLVGASRHQDRPDVGWALRPEHHEQDMALMAEMGVNTIRHAHYQHAQEWSDLADRNGMVVWAEVPFVSAAAFDGNPANEATTANARQQLTELVRQNYNHPSIMMWSVGNEVDAAAIFLNNGLPARSLSLLRNLNDLARQEDPTRPTVFADCCEASAYSTPDQERLAGTTDLIGYNRYFGWYYGMPAQLGQAMDRFHAEHPTLPMSVSEYGAGGALSQHSDNPLGGPISSFGRPHPEEYQSWFHEESWRVLSQRPYIFANWIWNMFDFASDLREEGEAIDLNDKGLVTFDRSVRKDGFYFYKAQWSNEPVLHLTGRRYVDRAYPVMDVRVYSNADRVSGTINGRDLGTVACEFRICVFPSVRLAEGANRVVVTGSRNGQALTDEVVWNGPAASAGVRIDVGDLAVRSDPQGRLFGSDNFFSGGAAHWLNVAVLRGQSANARREVTGAANPALYEAYRDGAMTYQLPVVAGRYQVRIHSFEPDTNRTTPRRFALAINGRTVNDRLMPGAEGALRAVSWEFDATAGDNGLTMQLTAVDGDPVVAAIEVLPEA
jgi:beta-galactosidase